MIEFACLSCKRTFQVPNEDAGRKVRCQTCGCVMRIPSGVSGPGRDGVTYGIDARAAEAEAYLERRSIIPKSPSSFFGIVLPLAVVAGAVWFGFVRQDIPVPGAGRVPPRGWVAQGPAAVWAGAASVALAVAAHAACFWVPRERFRVAGYCLFGLGIVAFFVASAMAAIKQDKVIEDRRQEWDRARQAVEEILRRLEEDRPRAPPGNVSPAAPAGQSK